MRLSATAAAALRAFTPCAHRASAGKILIQRDEATALPVLMYSKLPPALAGRPVLLLDPMLATGGSCIAAIKVLVEKGVPASSIVFVNIVWCPLRPIQPPARELTPSTRPPAPAVP